MTSSRSSPRPATKLPPSRGRPVAGADRESSGRDSRSAVTPAVRKILDEFQLGLVPSHLIRRAHFVAEELFAQEFAAEALTPRQKATLVIVYQNPGMNQNALADRLFMDRNTVAEMVQRLATNGFIQRLPSAEDHRAYGLFLAPAGAAMLNVVMPRDGRVEQRILDRLPIEYQALFLKCLRLIVEPAATATKT